MPCEWNPEKGCGLNQANRPIIDYKGKSYCDFHLPLESISKPKGSDLGGVWADLINNGTKDFSGIELPGRTNYRTYSEFIMPNARVGQGASILAGDYGAFDFSGTTFEPETMITTQHSVVLLTCRNARFNGNFSYDNADGRGTAIFGGSTFLGSTRFGRVDNLARLSFDNCKFEAASPKFSHSSKLPQGTTFRDASFASNAVDEHAFRSIRLMFEGNKDRDSEGQFYALEKRSQRHGLPRGIQRSISFLYDLTTEYGQSFERAFLSFLVVQTIFYVLYAGMSGRLEFGGSYDSRVLSFTVAQIVKPFELFSPKGVGVNPYDIGADTLNKGWWQLFTVTQSVISIALIALFLLALRWRFKRE
jgi:hypothetical protein